VIPGGGSAPAAPATPPAGGAASPPPAAPSAASPDWIGGLDPAQRGLVEAKGWKTPADALGSYANLEKALGADKLALPPKGKDGNRDFAAWDGWQALGRPDKPDDYAFAVPEGREFTGLDDRLISTMRPALHKAGLAQWQVDTIREAFRQNALAIEADAAKAAEADRAALAKEWGQDFDRQIEVANRAVRAVFGEDLEAVKTILLADGRFLLDDARLARGFARLGALLGEDGALAEGRSAPGMPATPAAARAEIERIRGEAFENPKHAYNDAKHPEHQALHERVRQLYRVAQGGAR
jgi:hypothetical protein